MSAREWQINAMFYYVLFCSKNAKIALVVRQMMTEFGTLADPLLPHSFVFPFYSLLPLYHHRHHTSSTKSSPTWATSSRTSTCLAPTLALWWNTLTNCYCLPTSRKSTAATSPSFCPSCRYLPLDFGCLVVLIFEFVTLKLNFSEPESFCCCQYVSVCHGIERPE